MFFRKQKFDVKQLKLNKFIFDIKLLEMSRFIQFISDLIISTSIATLEVPLLHPSRMILIGESNANKKCTGSLYSNTISLFYVSNKDINAQHINIDENVQKSKYQNNGATYELDILLILIGYIKCNKRMQAFAR